MSRLVSNKALIVEELDQPRPSSRLSGEHNVEIPLRKNLRRKVKPLSLDLSKRIMNHEVLKQLFILLAEYNPGIFEKFLTLSKGLKNLLEIDICSKTRELCIQMQD